MGLHILSCGIFRPELDIIISEVKSEVKHDIIITYLSPGLHNDCNKMEKELIENLDKTRSAKTLVLYGSGCHTKMPAILKNYGAVLPREKNCIEMMLTPEIKAEMDKTGNVIYLTTGWLKAWKEIFLHDSGMGPMIADKIIYLDCGTNSVSDEAIIEFFDFANLPVEIEKITLDNFKN
ncbi:MAG: DUF1638 domain-containing protein, partial [Spirochaetaceae bacterium]|nr:DUF1638 domain-containing protein [Spirochaetaceae bacterium]